MSRSRATDACSRRSRRKFASRGQQGCAENCYSLFVDIGSPCRRGKPMPSHAGNFMLGGLAGTVCLAGSLNFPAMAQGPSPPNLNSSVGWYAYNRLFIPPASGPGPVVQDSSLPYVSNDEFRVTGRQPTQRVADLNNPILQPWARDALRKHNEIALSGKRVPYPTANCSTTGPTA